MWPASPAAGSARPEPSSSRSTDSSPGSCGDRRENTRSSPSAPARQASSGRSLPARPYRPSSSAPQQRVLQLLRQLCDSQLVFHQMLPVIRPVLLPLLPEVGPRPRPPPARARGPTGSPQVKCSRQFLCTPVHRVRSASLSCPGVSMDAPKQSSTYRRRIGSGVRPAKAEQRLLLQTAAAAGRVM